MKRLALPLLLSACVIPSLDRDGKSCPCTVGYTCDPTTQLCLPTSDASAVHDGGVEDGASTTEVEGEQIELAAGWQASLYVDFSADYTYNVNDFQDGVGLDNAPSGIVVLSTPFQNGLAIQVGRKILELPTGGTPLLHDYTPIAANDGTYPDLPSDLFFARKAGGYAAQLLVAGSSLGAGDGLYAIDSNWAMTRVADANNVDTVAEDVNGYFDGESPGDIYYAQYPSGNSPTLIRYPVDKTILDYTAPATEDIEPLPDGTLGLVVDSEGESGTQTLAHVTSDADAGTYALSLLPVVPATSMALVTGELSRVPNALWAMSKPASLLTVPNGQDAVTIAHGLDENWVWVAAAIPPKTQSSALVFYVLESNRVLGKDRILAITAPAS